MRRVQNQCIYSSISISIQKEEEEELRWKPIYFGAHGHSLVRVLKTKGQSNKISQDKPPPIHPPRQHPTPPTHIQPDLSPSTDPKKPAIPPSHPLERCRTNPIDFYFPELKKLAEGGRDVQFLFCSLRFLLGISTGMEPSPPSSFLG